MDAFTIIQNFFTKMPCQACSTLFETDDIKLEGEGDGYYMVSLECHHCGHHNGTAAVGIEAGAHLEDLMNMDPDDIAEVFASVSQQRSQQIRKKRMKRFKDPEFTERDRRRLSEFSVIGDDDVLDAHEFFEELDSDWQKHIPKSLRPKSLSLPE